MATRPKADTSFDRGRAQLGLTGKRWAGVLGGGDPGESEFPAALDTGAVAELFGRYGAYLELIGEGAPVGEARTFEFPRAETA